MGKIIPQKSYEERSSAFDWNSLTLANAYVFATVMKNKAICKGMLERFLDQRISDFTYLEAEKTMDLGPLSKSVRLDVYVESSEDTTFDIEMQAQDTGELEKRARYHRSIIDIESLEKGRDYRQLGDSYVIFICRKDVFRQGQYRYTFKSSCEEVANLKLNDGSYILFFYTKGIKGEISKELKALFDYMEGKFSDDSFVQLVDREVQRIKNNARWRRDYMIQRDYRMDYIEEGREEGRIEGREEGRIEGKVEMVKKMLEANLSLKEVVKISGLSMEKIRSLAS